MKINIYLSVEREIERRGFWAHSFGSGTSAT